MKVRPVMFRCLDDFSMAPHPRFMRLCERQFVPGEDYALMPIEEVSHKSRGGLFAACKAAFDNLAEEYDGRFPSSEHLRKWGLVQVGHCTEASFVMDTEADAKKIAIGLRKADEYAVISCSGKVTKMWIAKSISGPAIKAIEFKEVKKRFLDLMSSITRATPAQLEEEGARQGRIKP